MDGTKKRKEETLDLIEALVLKLCPESYTRFDISESGTAVLIDPGSESARASLIGSKQTQYNALRRVFISLSAIDRHRYTIVIK